MITMNASGHGFELDGSQYDILLRDYEIEERVQEVAEHVANCISGEITVMPVMRGAKEFSDLLLEKMIGYDPTLSISVDPIQVKSYRGDQSGELEWVQKPTLPITPDTHLLVIEDIIDSGQTFTELDRCLRGFDPASIMSLTMFDRVDGRTVPYTPDIAAFKLYGNPKAFVVGMGLDYKQEGRGLPHVYERVGEYDRLVVVEESLPDLNQLRTSEVA